jgi:hypothetical protein
MLHWMTAQAVVWRAIRRWSGTETMADLLNLAMLACASIASMAFGILAAYGILRAGFALMRPQPRPASVKAQPQVARGL